MKLDHLAICATDLEEGVAWAEARLGVPFGAGGRHERFGTHNRLLGLGDGLYLEVIAPDPQANCVGPRWFGLDAFTGPPRLGNWICRVPDIEAALAEVPECGRSVALERDALRWSISVPDNGGLPEDGALPTLIQWQVNRTPGDTLPASSVRFRQMVVEHPLAEVLQSRVDVRGVTYKKAPRMRFSAEFDTPHGRVWL